MMMERGLRAFLFGVAAFALATCGNEEGMAGLEEAGQLLRNVGGGAATGGGRVPSERIATALEDGDGALLLVLVEDRNSEALLPEIERNAGYVTFATADRQTLTLRRGIVTATRGLGGDLMSADIAALDALLSARRAGNARRVMRYLDGNEQTVALVFDCAVTRGELRRVEAGRIDRTALEMTETCRDAGGREIENTFLVTAAGEVIASRQWLGELNGYATLTRLRE